MPGTSLIKSVGTSHKPAGGPQQHLLWSDGGPSLGLGQISRQRYRRPFSGPRPNINAALGAALFRAHTKQLHEAVGGASRGLGLLSRSVPTNHRQLTNPASSIKGDSLGLRNQPPLGTGAGPHPAGGNCHKNYAGR